MSPEQLLGELDGEGQIVICDLEAGIGTSLRLRDGQVDIFVAVVEPTTKSIEVARRVASVASDRGARVVVAANRVTSDEDLERIVAAFPHLEIIAIPDDPAVSGADRAGVAPIDIAPESPAVAALGVLAAVLATPAA